MFWFYWRASCSPLTANADGEEGDEGDEEEEGGRAHLKRRGSDQGPVRNPFCHGSHGLYLSTSPFLFSVLSFLLSCGIEDGQTGGVVNSC